MMGELVVILLVSAVIALAALLGKSKGKESAAAQVGRAEAQAAEAAVRESLARRAQERTEQAQAIETEARNAVTPTDAPRARMDAVDRWARLRAQERRRRAAMSGHDDSPAVPSIGTAPGRRESD